MEVGSCVKCAETFSACGCGSKAAERYEAYEDPISDRQEYKIDELGGKVDKSMTRSEASDYIKELQGRESGTWRAESSPLPPDPRVSPLNEGLYTPSDTPEMAAESKFDKLAKEIAEEYEEKGKSPKEAMEIGEATAAKIGRAKFGKKKFAKMGQKAEDDIDFDEAKADRNKDGRISDWERAVGNAVAKGIRDHKGAESAFDRLEDEVADEYEEKGMSDKEAKRIGAAVAYEQGVKKYGKKIMSEAARKGVSARSLERRAEVGPHVPTRIGATTTTRGVVKTFD